jgi:hypothetical protein
MLIKLISQNSGIRGFCILLLSIFRSILALKEGITDILSETSSTSAQRGAKEIDIPLGLARPTEKRISAVNKERK